MVVSGTVSACQRVRSLDALFSTGYGQLLLVKLLVFLPLLVLGYANRYHLVPLVERTIAPSPARCGPRLRWWAPCWRSRPASSTRRRPG